ncbi:hypothetical protein NRIC_11950 [Enterococcus florum]|uniref:Uncharacterized protein n=1 Tax=Enterococcus florum TaxID=2480627 RepID=A0A4P5PA91_9ENTE|nr:oligosaccharide flippase family protein [Enterococcus florum]GCF93304.1 hypothetical protein NRIC_11950 [Enterococcus florum]
MKNVAKNFMYQTVFQLTKIILPIVTIPIVSNALGPVGIGVYNYTYSIAQYFVLLAGLGVTIYGNREVALVWKKSKKSTSIVFCEIFVFKMIISSIVLIMYFVLSFFVDNKGVFLSQIFVILAVMFDISWFFMGIEDFRKTSMVNLIVQLFSFVFIILLVKDEKDVVVYTLIQSLGIMLSQLLVWVYIRKHIKFVKVNIRKCLQHIKGSIDYFIPQVAIMLYTNLNKTILGFYLGAVAVGYYANSLQLNTVFITIITTLDLVLLPHMTSLFASKESSKIVRMMEKTINLQLFISIPTMFGMLIVYDKLVPWFFGSKFLFINKIIPLFSILIVVIPLGMSISRQYLMPVGRVKEYNKSVLLGAGINILLNAFLLPLFGFFGVVFANIFAELFVTIVRVRSFLKSTDFKFNVKNIISYTMAALIMFFLTRLFTHDMPELLWVNIVQAIIAVLIYFVIVTFLRTNPIIEFIRNKRI